MEQSVPPPPPPPPLSPPAPPARSSKNLWLIIGVIVIAVVVVAAAFLLMGGGGGGGDGDGNESPLAGDMQVGDFLEYEFSMNVGMGDMEYLYWMNVTAIDASGYTMLITTYMEGYGEYSDSTYISKTDTISPTDMPEGVIDKGQTTIDTEFGDRAVKHYQIEQEGTTMDFYIGVNNGVLYKLKASGSGVSGEMKLTESNISWV